MTQYQDSAAGICGLFCGSCLAYLADYCHGCLSDKVAPMCQECRHGFRICSAEHHVTHCFECFEFPCQRLEDFKNVHIENGIVHHAYVVEDLKYMKEHGISTWLQLQAVKCSCKNCGEIIPWNETICPKCGGGR